jgi:hypothetical protein
VIHVVPAATEIALRHSGAAWAVSRRIVPARGAIEHDTVARQLAVRGDTT